MQPQALTLGSVLVLEDEAHAQARAERLLREVGGAAVRIDIAADLAGGRAMASRGTHYDLALVDVQLPDGNGVDFIAWLRDARPGLPAVIVSSWAEEGTILRALRCGAVGYLLKNAEDVELAMHLRSLQRGGAPIDPVIARRLLELMPQSVEPEPKPEFHLSPREVEVLEFVSRGLSNREIAEATGASRLTIETHTRNIYRKLEVGSRTAAVHQAKTLGLLH